MLGSFVIVFREVLEAAIIIGVVLAATKGVPKRNQYIGAGVAVGVVLSVVLAFFTDNITDSLEGMGQEVLNAGIMLSAAVLIGWAVVWFKVHAKEVIIKAKDVGTKVSEGLSPLHMLTIVVGLSVLREGAETVLFLYGIAANPTVSVASIFSGGVLGLVAGTIMGFLIYLGLIQFSTKHFFVITSWLLTFLAAGMAAQAAKFLSAVDKLPTLVETMWDTSWLLADDGVVGQFLHILVGYSARPSGIMVLFYVATLCIIIGFMKLEAGRKQWKKS